MAASKKTSDDIVEAVQEEAKPAVKVEPAPNNTARPNDNPIGKYRDPNSTFAERAKKSGRNKRVDNADTEGK